MYYLNKSVYNILANLRNFSFMAHYTPFYVFICISFDMMSLEWGGLRFISDSVYTIISVNITDAAGQWWWGLWRGGEKNEEASETS